MRVWAQACSNPGAVWRFIVGGGLVHRCFHEEAGESRKIATTAIEYDTNKDAASLDTVAASSFFLLLIKLSLDFLFFRRLWGLDVLSRHVTTAHLPFHEFVECALWVRAELFVGAFLGYPTFRVDADNTVGPFDR